MSAVSASAVVREGVLGRLDRHRIIFSVAAFAGMFGLLLVRALGRPAWHDEIFTVLVGRLPLSTALRAYLDGVDYAPPLYTLLVHLVEAMFHGGIELARMPAVVAFLLASLTVGVIVARRSTWLAGSAGVALLWLSGGWRYATEARGYALTMAACAVAAYSWSELDAGRRRTLHAACLALALGAGLWSHYYFALLFLPLGLGELVRQWRRRKFETLPWLAFVSGGAALAPLLPLMRVAGAQRGSFWTTTHPTDVPATYAFLLGAFASRWVAAGAAAFVVLLIVASVRRRQRQHGEDDRGMEPARLPVHEVVAGTGALLIPAIATVAGHYSGVFTERYVTYVVVAFAVVMPLALWTPRSTRVQVRSGFVMLTAIAAVASGWRAWNDVTGWRPLDGRSALVRQFEAGESVVVSGATAYLQLWFYTPAEWQNRAIYLAEPSAEERFNGGRTVDLNYLALARWTPVPVVPMEQYVAAHRRFRLYSFGQTWTEAGLTALGAELTEVDRDSQGRVYEVRFAEGPNQRSP